MRRVPPNANRTVQAMILASEWLDQMRVEGEIYGPEFLRHPPNEWGSLLQSSAHYRSYGTLTFVLAHAHGRLVSNPAESLELVCAILPFLDDVETPDAVYLHTVRGVAWREYGNALIGRNLKAALSAAETSAEILDYPGLGEEQAKSYLLQARILRETGEHERAMRIARQSASTFDEFGNALYYLLARMIEACVLFSLKQFREALGIFSELVESAERQNDELTLARALWGTAECARELGDAEASRSFGESALRHFEACNATAELPRIRWSHGLSLAAQGKFGAAISELFKVRAEFLRLGLLNSAASAGLDVLRVMFDRGDDVSAFAAELVKTLNDSGLTLNAIEALAYVREQARFQALDVQKIAYVRDYFRSLERQPARLFDPPSIREDET